MANAKKCDICGNMYDYEPSDFIDAIDQADIIIEADEYKAESEG